MTRITQAAADAVSDAFGAKALEAEIAREIARLRGLAVQARRRANSLDYSDDPDEDGNHEIDRLEEWAVDLNKQIAALRARLKEPST